MLNSTKRWEISIIAVSTSTDKNNVNKLVISNSSWFYKTRCSSVQLVIRLYVTRQCKRYIIAAKLRSHGWKRESIIGFLFWKNASFKYIWHIYLLSTHAWTVWFVCDQLWSSDWTGACPRKLATIFFKRCSLAHLEIDFQGVQKVIAAICNEAALSEQSWHSQAPRVTASSSSWSLLD